MLNAELLKSVLVVGLLGLYLQQFSGTTHADRNDAGLQKQEWVAVLLSASAVNAAAVVGMLLCVPPWHLGKDCKAPLETTRSFHPTGNTFAYYIKTLLPQAANTNFCFIEDLYNSSIMWVRAVLKVPNPAQTELNSGEIILMCRTDARHGGHGVDPMTKLWVLTQLSFPWPQPVLLVRCAVKEMYESFFPLFSWPFLLSQGLCSLKIPLWDPVSVRLFTKWTA